MLFVVLYVFFYFFAVGIDSSSIKVRHSTLLVTCFVLAFMAGQRDFTWSDTIIYYYSFRYYTPPLSHLTPTSRPLGYSEMGFYYLGTLIKEFSKDYTVYFLTISFLTFSFLFIAFKKYCYYPILGVCVYISRFYFSRNFMQIRAGLSYAIIMVAVQYITKRDWKRYFALVFLAYLMHQSALIAVPLYFLCLVKVRKWHIVVGLIISFIIAGFFSDVVNEMVSDNASDLSVSTYVNDEYKRAWGLSNPMIYYQTFLLLYYTFTEKRMKLSSEHYLTIRTAYFFSTTILIILSTYTALSGRVSSLFATLEIVIIPSIAFSFQKRNRIIAFLAIAVVMTFFFYMNSGNLRR